MVAAEEALRAGRPEEARAHGVVARDLTTRPLLPGIESFWLEHYREPLRACLVRALEALSESASSCGDASLAISSAEQAVTLEPYRASAHRHLMYAHIAGGNRAEALRAYRAAGGSWRRARRCPVGGDGGGVRRAPGPGTRAGACCWVAARQHRTPHLAAALPVAQPFPFVGRQAECELLDDA